MFSQLFSKSYLKNHVNSYLIVASIVT